ncbi:sensor domain-containing diguanylate cyclase [Ancylobacter sp. 6x-1]|uniref:diguanylate cyclase n=1 Tax=Ancylobacter crimeensis TaxID=2579147 RepID=A0ABT0DCP5_9HYPH|nr:sensor domain-containing diguanylate cyclase [Ancylobacter crimeensis]MCK0197722.1 sensor domain-containing diguanylate cyclase [Ancylobacter crimeensis]
MHNWVHAIDAAILIVRAADFQTLALNRRAHILLAVPPGIALPRPVAEIVPLASSADFGAQLTAALDEVRHGFFIELCGDVSNRLVHCSIGFLDGAYALTLEEKLPLSLRDDLIKIVDQIPVGIEIYDAEMQGLFFNKASDELFLYEERHILNFDDWWECGFPDEAERTAARAEWKAQLQLARAEPGRLQFSEWSVRCRDGTQRIVQFRYRWIGQYCVLALWDVTSQRETERELRHLAVSDPLTGLWNRRRFEQEAVSEVARRGRSGLSLVLIDIDNFKVINDTHGHPVGDEVLREVSRRLETSLRSNDLLARIGGEEFAVLLPGVEPDDAADICGRLLGAIADVPINVNGQSLAVTVSIGCASLDGIDDSGELIARADRALYRAKAAGRNRICQHEARQATDDCDTGALPARPLAVTKAIERPIGLPASQAAVEAGPARAIPAIAEEALDPRNRTAD